MGGNKIEVAKSGEATKLFADLDKPSLESLSYILRHPDTWPKGFVWSYGDCDCCAMGLAHELWRKHINLPMDDDEAEEAEYVSAMAREFAMSYGDAKNIFWDAAILHTKSVVSREPVSSFLGLFTKYETVTLEQAIGCEAVTPEMVADDIDAYLASIKEVSVSPKDRDV